MSSHHRPSVSNHLCSVGLSARNPTRPNTTDGTAASRSIIVVMRASQPPGRDLRREQGNADADRDGQEHTDERDDQRAPDESEDAELLGVRVPVGREEVAEAVLRERGPRLLGRADRDQSEDHQHRDASAERDVAERLVTGRHRCCSTDSGVAGRLRCGVSGDQRGSAWVLTVTGDGSDPSGPSHRPGDHGAQPAVI